MFSHKICTFVMLMSYVNVNVCMGSDVRNAETDVDKNETHNPLWTRFYDHSIKNLNNGIVQVNILNIKKENTVLNKIKKHASKKHRDLKNNRTQMPELTLSKMEKENFKAVSNIKYVKENMTSNTRSGKCIPIESNGTDDDEYSFLMVLGFVGKSIILLILVIAGIDFYHKLDDIYKALCEIHITLKFGVTPNLKEKQQQDRLKLTLKPGAKI